MNQVSNKPINSPYHHTRTFADSLCHTQVNSFLKLSSISSNKMNLRSGKALPPPNLSPVPPSRLSQSPDGEESSTKAVRASPITRTRYWFFLFPLLSNAVDQEHLICLLHKPGSMRLLILNLSCLGPGSLDGLWLVLSILPSLLINTWCTFKRLSGNTVLTKRVFWSSAT